MIPGIMAMQVRSTAAAAYPEVRTVLTQSFNGTAHSIALPSACSAGDLMFVQIILDGNGTVATPAGWTRIINSGLVDGVNARAYVYRRIKQGGDAGTLDLVSTTSTRSSLIGWAVKTGTFNAAIDPVVSATVGTSNTPSPTSVTSPSGTTPSLVTAIMAADVRPTVTSFPLPDNNTQMLSTATPGVTAAICTQAIAVAVFDPGAFAINASVEWLAGTILVVGN